MASPHTARLTGASEGLGQPSVTRKVTGAGEPTGVNPTRNTDLDVLESFAKDGGPGLRVFMYPGLFPHVLKLLTSICTKTRLHEGAEASLPWRFGAAPFTQHRLTLR